MGAGSPLMQLTTSLFSSRNHPCPTGEGICRQPLWRLGGLVGGPVTVLAQSVDAWR